jgi:PAS domain S-box-containing protein
MSVPAPTWIEANFRVFLDAAPDAMLVSDDHGHIVLANFQVEKLFGYSASELLARKLKSSSSSIPHQTYRPASRILRTESASSSPPGSKA